MQRNYQPEDERKPVHELGDIIEAREQRRSAFAQDIDNQDDIEIPDDIDVDDALTFPHPRSKRKGGSVPVDEDMSGTTDEIISADDQLGTDFDYDDSNDEMLPTDYSGNYNEALTTDVADDNDEVYEAVVDNAGDIDTDDILYEELITEPLPREFHGEDVDPDNEGGFSSPGS